MRIDSRPGSYATANVDANFGNGPDVETHGLPSLDALTRILLSLETQDQAQLESQTERISAARERLDDLQRELMEDLAEALRHAQHARKKKKKGGWFSKTFGGAVDLVAKVIGKGAEVTKDLLVVQADMAVSLYQNFDNPSALRASIQEDLLEFTKSSETERATAGFIRGTARFSGDLAAFQVALVDALARGAVRGEAPAELVRAQSSRLYESLEQNVLHNPDFWTVVERGAQAAAVAGAVSSGGLLGPVALALILAIEADNRYGYVEDAVGRKAAPWVRLGMQVGLSTAAAAGGGSSDALRYIQGATAVLQGAHEVHQGVEQLHEARRLAAEVDANADVQETLNRMDQIRRLVDRLLETYEEQSDEQTTNRELSADLAQAHAASHAAVVFPA